MKKYISILLALVVILGCSVVAFADFVPMPSDPDAYDPEYIPAIPDFITPDTNPSTTGSLFDTSLDIEGSWGTDEQTFWDNFYSTNSPYLVLLSQGVYNRYNEEKGVQYDRQYEVYFLKWKSSSSLSAYSFGSFGHVTSPRHRQGMADGNTMRFLPFQNKFDVLVLKHDAQRNVWVSAPLLKNVSYSSNFTYVLASSPISGEPFYHGNIKMYPYHSSIGGKSFEVAGFAQGGAPGGNSYLCQRDYDWWLGIPGNDTPPVNPPYDPDKDLDKDTNGDGRPDINIDTDGNGKADLNIDTDGDGKPDMNIDTDGDNRPDINIDTDGDGRPDINIDTNEDGEADLNIDTNGDSKPDLNIDTDGDGKPDINIDTNGDKKPDLNVDTDGDGKADLNIDTNGNGKPNINIDTNGDKKPDLNIDTDGDGKADTNIDTDGDGIPDQNIKPGGGSGSGTPDSWWEGDSGGDLSYNSWKFFDPFQFEYQPLEWGEDYNPLKGYSPANMPDFPSCGIPDVRIKDPFDIPNDIDFKDYVDGLGGQ